MTMVAAINLEVTSEQVEELLQLVESIEKCKVCRVKRPNKPLWTPTAMGLWEHLRTLKETLDDHDAKSTDD